MAGKGEMKHILFLTRMERDILGLPGGHGAPAPHLLPHTHLQFLWAPSHTRVLAALGKPWSPAPKQTQEMKQFPQNGSRPVEGACSWQLTPAVRGSTPRPMA